MSRPPASGHLGTWREAYKTGDDPDRKLRAALALLRISLDDAPAPYVDYLVDRLLTCSPTEFPVIRDALRAAGTTSLVDRLWSVACDAHEDVNKRFHAACVLASYAPEDSRWKIAADDTAAHLISVHSLHLGIWTDALRNVRDQLVPTLAKIHGDETRSETDRYTATSILAGFASDRPKRSVELIQDADARQFDKLFPLLKPYENMAIEALECELISQETDDWGDGFPDPAWPDAPGDTVARIEAAWGIVTQHFALSPTLPLEDFRSVDKALSRARYRLSRLRPYFVDDSLQVAAIWERDGRAAHYECGIDSAEVMQRDKDLVSQSYRIVDIVGFADKRSPVTQCQYAAVWCKNARGEQTSASTWICPWSSSGIVSG